MTSLLSGTQAYQILEAGDMSGNLESSAFPSLTARIAVHAIWSGTPTGTLTLEGQVVSSSWKTLDICALSGGSGDVVFDLTTAVEKIRVTYTSTSGSGTLDVYVNNKYNH